jgi:urease accessory protein
MEIIRSALAQTAPGLLRIPLKVERAVLAKRRWRGRAEDGMEFGFDLVAPLAEGNAFFENDAASYVIEQKPEPVLELSAVNCGLRSTSDFARLGWLIGNLHFPLALDGDSVLVPDDPALRQLFEREHIAFAPCERVFKPLSGGHSHGH